MKNLLERSDAERKETPILSVMQFFPNALTGVADNIMSGQKQHATDSDAPIQWMREKSQDELGSLTRHLVDYQLAEKNGDREEMIQASKSIAWRALAHLERLVDTREVDPACYKTPVPSPRPELKFQNVRANCSVGQVRKGQIYKLVDTVTWDDWNNMDQDTKVHIKFSEGDTCWVYRSNLTCS